MKNEASLKLIAAEGKAAEEWLNNPLYKQAIIGIKSELVGAFERTKYKDAQDREEIWRKLQAVNWLVSAMERKVRNGKAANKTLIDKIKDKFN